MKCVVKDYNGTVNELVSKELNEAVRGKNLVVILCRCSIDYKGRSRSVLPEGDRIIIIKTNGSVIVHRPYGYSPVNWQPDTSYIRFEYNGTYISMTAVREKPREVLNANITRIYAIMVGRELEDNAKFSMYVSEKEVKDVIERHPEIIEKDLKITAREKRVETGIIDLVGIDKNGVTVLIEVKDEKAGIEAGAQLLKYVKAMEKTGGRVRGILVAPDFSKSLIEFLERNGLEKIRYDPDRIIEIIEKEFTGKRKTRTLEEYFRGQ